MNIQPNNHNESLSDRVLHRIEGEHIVPKSRWSFVFKNSFFWTFGAVTVALGACAVAAALFEIQSADWRLSPATHANSFDFFIATAPFIWVSALILFVLIGYKNIRHTKRGYRYPLTYIALGAVLTSLSLGTGLYAVGLGSVFEESVGEYPPYYRPILSQQRSWWLAPEKGLLTGTVIEVSSSTNSFVIEDDKKQMWSIDSGELHKPDASVVVEGGDVRVVGIPTDSTTTPFHACFVFKSKERGRSNDEKISPQSPPASTTLIGVDRYSQHSKECRGIQPFKQLHDIDGDE